MYADRKSWNCRVLLVDDDERMHVLFRRILKTPSLRLPPGDGIQSQSDAAFDVQTASQGMEAYEMVEAANAIGKPFALAFMDMEMPPGWDGIDTIARIRQIDRRIETAICTGHWDERRQARLDAIDGGIGVPIVAKPFQNSEIHQLASRLITRWNRMHPLISGGDSHAVTGLAAAVGCA